MSGQATGWVLRYGPAPDSVGMDGRRYGQRAHGLRAVLLVVADAANIYGQHAYPGIDAICEGSLYGRRQVSTILASLVADGWLTVESGGGGRGNATTYTVNMETMQPLHGSSAPKPRTLVPETAQSEPETVQSGLHTNGNTTKLLTEKPPPPDGSDAEARRIVTDFWQHCQTVNKPTPTLNGGRKGNPFMALVGIVGTLLDAGWSAARIKTALDVTAAYTLNSLTLTLNKIGGAKPLTAPGRAPMQNRDQPSGEVVDL